MSMYADYLRERTQDQILETEDGFATYRYIGEKQVYIVDIYIVPKMRKCNIATAIADEIAKEAKEKGCVEMIGTVAPSAKNATTSMRVLLGYGMELHSAAQDLIVFRKDI